MVTQYKVVVATVLFCLSFFSVQTLAKTEKPKETKSQTQEPTFPGGAREVNETYGDWKLVCAVQGQSTAAAKICMVSQRQTDAKSNSLVLQIDLRVQKDQVVDGRLIAPFGLLFKNGVTLNINDATDSASTRSFAFLTCLPAGCFVPLNFDDAFLKAATSAKTLKFGAVAQTGGTFILPISTKGLSDATAKAETLVK